MQINFAFLDVLSASPALGNDRLRALAVTSPTREPSLPNVPAVGEVLPGYAVQGWIGLHVSARTPKAVIERVIAVMLQAASNADFKKALEGRDLVVGGLPTSAMSAFFAEDVIHWTNWIRAAGIPPQ